MNVYPVLSYIVKVKVKLRWTDHQKMVHVVKLCAYIVFRHLNSKRNEISNLHVANKQAGYSFWAKTLQTAEMGFVNKQGFCKQKDSPNWCLFQKYLNALNTRVSHSRLFQTWDR